MHALLGHTRSPPRPRSVSCSRPLRARRSLHRHRPFPSAAPEVSILDESLDLWVQRSTRLADGASAGGPSLARRVHLGCDRRAQRRALRSRRGQRPTTSGQRRSFVEWDARHVPPVPCAYRLILRDWTVSSASPCCSRATRSSRELRSVKARRQCSTQRAVACRR